MTEMFEDLLEKVTLKHLIVASLGLVAATCALMAALMFSIPAYVDYLVEKEQARAYRWAETHKKIQLTLGDDVDLNEYLLIQKLEDTDIEEYNP